MNTALVELVGRLIAVEGHEDHPRHERAVADEVATWLAAAGVPVDLQELRGGRANVLARVRGPEPGPTLALVAHLDTVPPYDMPRALQAEVRDGRLYGRGAVDMKGALAAMMLVLAAAAQTGAVRAGELVLAATVGEECGSEGMQALAGSGLRADLAVVGEPTAMRVARAHKGTAWVEVAFRGVATHGSTPELGVNAVEHAADFVTRVRRDLAPVLRARSHPLLGSATVNVGVIRGGDRPPMVPAHCSVQLDRRWLPGETHRDVLGEIEELVGQMQREDPTVQATVSEMAGTGGFVHAPLECPPDDPLLIVLTQLAAERTGQATDPVGVQFWTDGALLAAQTGTRCVVCGPGSIEQAHSLDEWVALDQLDAAHDVYTGLVAAVLGGRTPGMGA